MKGGWLTAAGALGISTAPILFALSETAPARGALFRFAYALPALLLICALRPSARRSFRRARWLGLGAASGVFFALDLLMWHRSIELIGAGPATLLVNTQVVWVGLFGRAFLGQRPSAWFWAALPVLALGMALLGGATPSGFAAADRLGLILGAASSLMYAGALLCLRQVQMSGAVAPEAALTVQVVAAMAVVGAAAAWTDPAPPALAPAQHLWLVLLGLGPQVLAWFCIAAGIRRLPAYRGSLLLLLQPVASLWLGWWILGQSLGPGRILGAVGVLAGIFLALTPPRDSARLSESRG